MSESVDSFIIRRFRQEDQTAVRALILAGLAERWGSLDPALNPDLEDIGGTFAAGCFLVAVANGAIVGCGGLLPAGAAHGQVVRMSTAAGWRRHGVAARLLGMLEETAVAMGFRTLILETTSSWRSAVAFYRNQGYRITHKAGGDTCFEKQLPAVSARS